jgi:hypothetical protein
MEMSEGKITDAMQGELLVRLIPRYLDLEGSVWNIPGEYLLDGKVEEVSSMLQGKSFQLVIERN